MLTNAAAPAILALAPPSAMLTNAAAPARSLAYVYCKGLLAQGVYQYDDLELHI
jgi:hypothetical protein